MRKWTTALGAIALIGAPAAVRAQASGAVARIQAYNGALNAVMKAGGSTAKRADGFEPVVRDYYDMPAVAGLVVGPPWAKMSAAERASIVRALTRHSAVSLARNFTSTGETFTTSPVAVARGSFQLVSVKVGTDTLVYRLRESGGGWKIIDAQAQSVSQLAIQRADLAGTVASGGAAGLVKRLKQLDAVK